MALTKEPRPDRYEVFKASGGWAFRRIAANGEIVAQSEVYPAKASALEEAHRQADPAGLAVEEASDGS